MHCKEGTVKAYCTDLPPRCGFRSELFSSPQPSACSDPLFLVNLTDIYNSALLTSDYPHLPTLGMFPSLLIITSIITTCFQHREESLILTISWLCFRAAHLNQAPTSKDTVANMSLSILIRNRKLGHSGIHVYFILLGTNQILTCPIADNVVPRYQPYIIDQSIVQERQRMTMDLESATLALHAEALRRRHATPSLAVTRIIKKRKLAPFPLDSEMGPSTTVSSPAPILPESQELDAIDKLRRGDGVSSFELLGLIEQCGICKLYFTGGVLRRHIFVCSASEV